MDGLDISKEGIDSWEAAMKRYDDRIDRVEARWTFCDQLICYLTIMWPYVTIMWPVWPFQHKQIFIHTQQKKHNRNMISRREMK